ncbi:MAG: bifunctional diaminohydroxyphosphoribosylaminopyrimidine deaminase/5-amino-6-(5-phosphoribosylamino)uracil reductase RibD [Spirochaetia bacterium]|nr:bifunctional diaminohydroxyphosphoribosylaminopyrimidine deaminase/5-amino-6-(5-phosphoribosylamino)uracil reductase RibD [Spirochaetia bacterium]
MKYLHEAFMQSIYAIGNSDPNPPVGAILVSNKNKIIGSGYTQVYGSHHAEIMAIEEAKKNHGIDSLIGSTLYVTLEPCNHFGKTPPCTTAIKKNQISKVVIASLDQTDKVNGAEELRSSNIDVKLYNSDDFKDELLWTLDAFHYAQKNKKPRVILKWAQTSSGWLAPMSGKSGPISNAFSREAVFRIRKLFNSILVTPGTVLSDRPLLNSRFNGSFSLNLKNENFLLKSLSAFELNYPDEYRKNIKRFIMLPRLDKNWNENDLKEYLNLQASLEGSYFFITDDPQQEKLMTSWGFNCFVSDYSDISGILNYTYKMGAINLMVEAGPSFCKHFIENSVPNLLFIFKSRQEQWGKGRGFFLSFDAAQNNENKIKESGYIKLYNIQLNTDELQVYQKK